MGYYPAEHTHTAMTWDRGKAESYISSLRKCVKEKDFLLGKRFHDLIIQDGFEQRKDLGNLLVQIYGSCGAVDDALALFSKLTWRNIAAFNQLLTHYVRETNNQAVLGLHTQLFLEGIMPNRISYIQAVSACASEKNLDEGRRLLCRILCRDGMYDDGVMCTAIMMMYGKCSNVEHARHIFYQTVSKDVVCWTAIIAIHTQYGRDMEALQLFEEMQQSGVEPNEATFVSILKACVNLNSRRKGILIHHCIVDFGFESHVVGGNVLIDFYGRCGSVEDAEGTFSIMPKQDVATWNAMIATHALHGQQMEAFHFFVTMQKNRVTPNKITFICILGICTNNDMLLLGEWLYALICDLDLEIDIAVCNALLTMYGKCNSAHAVQDFFNNMPVRNIVSWNGLISVFARMEELEHTFMLVKQMECEGLIPDKFTLISMLLACASLRLSCVGKQIHASRLSNYLEMDTVLGNALMNMYAKSNDHDGMQMVYDNLQVRDICSYTTAIEMHVQQKNINQALQIFEQVLQEAVMPGKITFLNILSACKGFNMLRVGKQLHACIENNELFLDVVVTNAVLNMYCKCDTLRNAEAMFDAMPKWNLVTWNTIMQVYTLYDPSHKVLQIFSQMLMMGEFPDRLSICYATSICAELSALQHGKHMHVYMNANYFGKDDVSENVLIKMYGRCRNLNDAENIFYENDRMPSWNAMMAVYAEHRNTMCTIFLFNQMQQQGGIPDESAFVYALTACTKQAVLTQGLKLHACIECCGLHKELVVGNALLNMYVKCGNVAAAEMLFKNMVVQDVVTWTTIISMYAQHGQIQNTFTTLHEMLHIGVSPNHITLLSILNGCSHAGLVDASFQFLHRGMLSMDEHYVSMVDLLGRAGRLEEAEKLIKVSPVQQNIIPYIALLAACRHQTDVGRGEVAAKRVYELDPKNTAANILLADIYLKGKTVFLKQMNLIEDLLAI